MVERKVESPAWEIWMNFEQLGESAAIGLVARTLRNTWRILPKKKSRSGLGRTLPLTGCFQHKTTLEILSSSKTGDV